jgi:hypothetical protein
MEGRSLPVETTRLESSLGPSGPVWTGPPAPGVFPVRLNDPAYVGVAVTSLPGGPGFHRVRTPRVDHHQVAAIIRATAGLRADPGELLAEPAPGLRVVPGIPAPGEVA